MCEIDVNNFIMKKIFNANIHTWIKRDLVVIRRSPVLGLGDTGLYSASSQG